MKKILVTGVAGFVGSNIAFELLKKGYYVFGIDNLSQGFLRNIQSCFKNPNFKFKQVDILSRDLLFSLPDDFDCIVHLAAFKIPRYGNALSTLEVNTFGTRNILEFAKKIGSRLVFASTSDVYGKNPNLPFSESTNLLMGPTYVKRWGYAVSKMFDEHLCLAYYDEYKLPITIVRYFGGYGPNQNPTWRGGPQSVFIDCALKNKPMSIHGDGAQARSFTYISDMIDGTIMAMENPLANGEIFNIGCMREISIINLAKMTWLMINKTEPKIEYIPYNSFSGRYEDVKRRIPDITKSKNILGFQAKVKLEEGLPKTIAWQKTIIGNKT